MKKDSFKTKGRHLVLDCYLGDEYKELLENDRLILKNLIESAEEAGATVIGSMRYRFGHNSPPGFACLVMLDESHCSAHSYSELGLLALDFFTCGKTDPRDVWNIFRSKLNLSDERITIKSCFLERFT